MNTLAYLALLTSLTAVSPTHAEELGRLFFTPAQRTQLDRHKQLSAPTITNADTATDAPANEHSLTVNGIVQRNGGKRTAWINGAARTVGQSDDNTSVMVNLPDQNKSVRLKVGQRVLLSPPVNADTAKPGVAKPAPSDDD